MDSPVHLRTVVALLGGFPALAGADLSVSAGEAVLLRGPNGAGKSTLLRLCAGLVAPARGDAFVLGYDLSTDRRSVRRRVGLLGHAGFLYDDLTVSENVTFAVKAAAGDVGAISGALDRLGLSGRLASTQAGVLSAGQRRRTALAALVARAPELWLLDEPHAGLDAEGRDVLDDVVADARSAGATVLLASHDSDRARRLASREVFVAGGLVHDREHASAP
ncbi:MAG TPA: heme ABC exporter ATP-binding protein CcmA [Acidimicrobiales bacterium]|nr:heme ABC exporter ATP-binding protein CcmA [Acidimicrobiales bacterium]